MQVSKAQVLALLPPFNDQVRVANWGQSTNNIASEITHTHGKFAGDYDCICQLFYTGNVYTTCEKLWDFCKFELRYNKETKNEQTVKSPQAILQDFLKVDCKHYSLFIAGVLDAIKFHTGADFDWTYRLVSDKADGTIGHVFVAVFTPDQEIWVDPVMNYFDEPFNWTKIEDIEVMPVYEISGLSGTTREPTEITVNKKLAQQSFAIMAGQNFFDLKGILMSDPNILFGQVKQYYLANGLDFNQLLLSINYYG